MSDRLMNGEKLERGQSLTSRNGAYTLTLQDDGNLVLAAGSEAVWATATNGQNVERLEVQEDGNCVLYTADKPVWHTDTKGAKDVRLLLQDDRNLVLYGFDGPAWASNTQTDEAPPPPPATEAPEPAGEAVPVAAEEPASPAPEPAAAAAPPPPPPPPPPPRGPPHRGPTAATPAPSAHCADLHSRLRRHPMGDLGTLLWRRQQVSGDCGRQRRLQPRPYSSGSGAHDSVAQTRRWPGPKGPGHHCVPGWPAAARFADGASARRWVCNVAASLADEQLRVPLRELFGYSNPQLSGTLYSLDT